MLRWAKSAKSGAAVRPAGRASVSARQKVSEASSDQVPAGWRWESYGGVQVGVPGDWGWDEGPVRLALRPSEGPVLAGPRTGLRLAPDRPWRFWLADEPTVSTHRRHPGAVAEGPDLYDGEDVL